MDPNNNLQPQPKEKQPDVVQPPVAENTASSQNQVPPVADVSPENAPPPPNQPTPPPPPPATEGPVEDSPEEETQKKERVAPLIWVVVAVLLIFVLVGGYFILQQTVLSGSGSSENKTVDRVEIPPTGTPAPQVLPELGQVPTVSDDTSLETIDAELNSLSAGDYETELKALDSEADQL